MTLKLNVHETLQMLRDADLTASARIAIDDLLEEVSPDEEFQLDLHELLQRNRLIALIWSIEDVQEVRPDLTDGQAWEVLEQAGRKQDAELGITWTTLECVAEDLFGEAPETAAEEE
jgi:hypothetical protein